VIGNESTDNIRFFNHQNYCTILELRSELSCHDDYICDEGECTKMQSQDREGLSKS
jgi:hypothetical protein